MNKTNTTSWIVVILAVMLLGALIAGVCVVGGGVLYFFALPSPAPPPVEITYPESVDSGIVVPVEETSLD